MQGVRGSTRDVAGRWLSGYFVTGALMLVVGGFLGYALGMQLSPEFVAEQAQKAAPDDGEITFLDLLINNTIAMTAMGLGAFSIGTITAFALLYNGVVIGVVVNIALREISALKIFLLVAPHGILEIPAMLIVGSIGLRFGHRTIRYLRDREDELYTRSELTEALALYCFSLVLIVIAAWIEANHTIAIAESLT